MEIQYKNSQGTIITAQQAREIEDYFKSYYNGVTLLKEEEFYQNKLMGLLYYNNKNENHLTIVNDNSSSSYKWITIIEYEYFNGYKLEKQFGYKLNGTFTGIDLSLYNVNGELIAHGYKNADGNYDYERSRKYYWDRNVNSDDELLECTYYENNGLLRQLYWNNFHIDEDGQESFVLLNTPEDIQKLIDLTGISPELAEYYMSSEITPTW